MEDKEIEHYVTLYLLLPPRKELKIDEINIVNYPDKNLSVICYPTHDDFDCDTDGAEIWALYPALEERFKVCCWAMLVSPTLTPEHTKMIYNLCTIDDEEIEKFLEKLGYKVLAAGGSFPTLHIIDFELYYGASVDSAVQEVVSYYEQDPFISSRTLQKIEQEARKLAETLLRLKKQI